MPSEPAIDVLRSPTMLAAAAQLSELRGGPQLAVLDTSCVRTGLKGQLEYGGPPRSIREVQRDRLRLFIAYETLSETCQRLERFAKQFAVPVQRLVDMLNEDWLPFITVVRLPEALKRVDARASEVESLDADDFPAAALAALLSPAILLTHNFKDFAPLGVRGWSQGTDAVLAAGMVSDGGLTFQGMLILPTAPALAVGAGVKWVTDNVGPAGWLLVPLAGLCGYYLFRRQSPERQERWKGTAVDAVKAFVEIASKAADDAEQARSLLERYVVPGPEERTPISAVMRLLARSSQSMSAEQICEALRDDVRPSVARLRDYLHANKDEGGPFVEVRRGGFELGRKTYQIQIG